MIAPEHGRVTIGSTVVRYTIVRSRRRTKTVELQVDGERHVRVATPAAATRQRVEHLLRQRTRWLIPRLSSNGHKPHEREFVNGETFLYLGRQARLRVIEAEPKLEREVRLARGRLEVRVRRGLGPRVRRRRVQEALERWYRERAAAKLPQRVAMYAAKLGVRPQSIVIRDQTKRWGSCSKDGVLRFNWRIIMAPMSLVDYVVVHELAHLAGNNEHAARFWATVAAVMPDYDQRRQQLRKRGAEFQLGL